MIVKQHDAIVDLIGCEVSVTLNDRTDLKERIRKWWVGRDHSDISIQRVQYTYRPRPGYEKYGRETGGKIVVPEYMFERDDIFCVQLTSHGFGCNIFVEPDGSYDNIQPWGGAVVYLHQLSSDERMWLQDRMAEILGKHNEYINRQRKWFAEKPWQCLHGLTPEEAVAKLEEMGW